MYEQDAWIDDRHAIKAGIAESILADDLDSEWREELQREMRRNFSRKILRDFAAL